MKANDWTPTEDKVFEDYKLLSNREIYELKVLDRTLQAIMARRKRLGYKSPLKLYKYKVGQEFNDLKLIEITNDILKHQRIGVFECKCQHVNCRKIVRIRIKDVVSGSTKACGISRISFHEDYKGIKGIIWTKYKYRANKKDIPFIISIEDAWDLYIKQKGRCALTNRLIGFEYTGERKMSCTASLDRIDSSIGYTKNNCQWIHKDHQMAKNTSSNEEYKLGCGDIHICDRNKSVVNLFADIISAKFENSKFDSFTDHDILGDIDELARYLGHKDYLDFYHRNSIMKLVGVKLNRRTLFK